MPSLIYTAIDDLVNTTLEKWEKGRANQLAQTYQDYPFTQRLMNKHKVSFEGGDYISRQLLVRPDTAAAANVGFFEVDNVNVIKLMEQLKFPWCFTHIAWAYDVKEPQLNRGPQAIVNLIKQRETAAMIAKVELMENDFWTRLPATADNKRPFGVDYYINKVGAVSGFFGGNPTGFPGGAGGLPIATAASWRNYCAEYANVSKDDLITEMRAAFVKTNWRSPVKVNETNRGRRDLGVYADYDNVISVVETLGEAQNDNLGKDIASMDGRMLFRGVPFEVVHHLTNIAEHPVYMIDWAWFYPVVQSGSYMRKTGPLVAGDQHDTRHIHYDTTWNVVCDNRRRQAVIQTA